MEIGNALVGRTEQREFRQSNTPEDVAGTHSVRSGLQEVALNPSGEPADAALRIREHSLIYAMIETNNAEQTRIGLSSKSPWSVRAALVALNEMRDGDLKPEDVIPRMSDSDEAVRLTAAWIVKQHPDWGSALSEYFSTRLASIDALNETNATTPLISSRVWRRRPRSSHCCSGRFKREATQQLRSWLCRRWLKADCHRCRRCGWMLLRNLSNPPTTTR